jgi:hypothetical protein
MAESAPGVGQRTWIFLVDEDGLHVQAGEPWVKEARRLWEAGGAPRIPQDVTKRMAALLPERFIY